VSACPTSQGLNAKAAISFGHLAARFAAQPETWPVFHAWMQTQGISPEFSREMAEMLIGHLSVGIIAASELL
jgi:hypothetical protein